MTDILKLTIFVIDITFSTACRIGGSAIFRKTGRQAPWSKCPRDWSF
ncbi:MAG: hypothetical protein WBG17_02995 [Burkholderiaceae bacterium]